MRWEQRDEFLERRTACPGFLRRLGIPMSAILDRTAPVRKGEELPVPQLEAYLTQSLLHLTGPLQIEQFPHGHSNLTYSLRSGATELVLRRPPYGNQVKTAHDMGREYRVLSGLHAVYPLAPRPYLYCEDEGVLGAPFYVMERRRGTILRKVLPAGMELAPGTAKRLSAALVDNLVLLHSLDYRAIGLGDLGKPEGYVSRQVTGWINRYQAAQTDQQPAVERVARWLGENLPVEVGAAVIHNDYKYDNLVLDPTDLSRIVAVLDWEMATVGDPLMDLGTTLGYWVEAGDPAALLHAAMGPTSLPGNMTRRQIVESYAAKTGRPVDDAPFYYCFGLFKIAVIIQQIYARYVRGHTQDPRFAGLNQLVTILGEQADRTLTAGRI
jgi:aminoglycoside phosphotransferase (APT) family kinase protein